MMPSEQRILVGIERFTALMKENTISMVTLGQDLLPTRFRSGIIIARADGSHVAVTAAHRLGIVPWHIETFTPDKANGTLNIRAGTLSQVVKEGAWDDDLAFHPFPSTEFARENIPAASVPAYKGPVSMPVKREAYGFAVWRQAEIVPANPHHQAVRELVTECGMEYIGDQGGHFIFKLDDKHKGHDWYEGISGAPIADPSGLIVAIVQGGNCKDHTIFGQPLVPYAGQLGIPVVTAKKIH